MEIFNELFGRHKDTQEFIEIPVRGGMKGFTFWEGDYRESKHRKTGTKLYKFACPYCMYHEVDNQVVTLATNFNFMISRGSLNTGNFLNPPCACNKDKNKILKKYGVDLNVGAKYFTKDSTITLGKSTGISNLKKYKVYCSKCSMDTELFPILEATKANMDKGSFPCECGGSPKWTEPQYLVRISRLSKAKGLNFKGFSGKYKGNKTKLLLNCTTHGDWNTTSIDHFLGDNKGCKLCHGGGGYKTNLEGCFYIKNVGKVWGKFGITNREPEKRSKEHKTIYKEGIIFTFTFEDGTIPPLLESLAKKCMDVKVLSKREIRSGYTETFRIEDLPYLMHEIRPYIKYSKEHKETL